MANIVNETWNEKDLNDMNNAFKSIMTALTANTAKGDTANITKEDLEALVTNYVKLHGKYVLYLISQLISTGDEKASAVAEKYITVAKQLLEASAATDKILSNNSPS